MALDYRGTVIEHVLMCMKLRLQASKPNIAKPDISKVAHFR
jgi:hypothetical protein